MDEWELSKRYLQIEKLRMGDRLKVEWQVDELPDNALIPQLTIQPLLENAIYHGIEQLRDGGTININGKLENKQITITIINPLPKDARPQSRVSNKMAQENIKQRLSAVYGSQGRLKVNHSGTQYELIISFPYIQERQ